MGRGHSALQRGVVGVIGMFTGSAAGFALSSPLVKNRRWYARASSMDTFGGEGRTTSLAPRESATQAARVSTSPPAHDVPPIASRTSRVVRSSRTLPSNKEWRSSAAHLALARHCERPLSRRRVATASTGPAAEGRRLAPLANMRRSQAARGWRGATMHRSLGWRGPAPGRNLESRRSAGKKTNVE